MPRRTCSHVATAGILVSFVHFLQPRPVVAAFRFTEVSEESGIRFIHAPGAEPGTLTQRVAGGVAAGDYDRDGDVDLYLVGGSAGVNALFRNDGGSFEDTAASAGVALAGFNSSGPLFFDFDGDAWLDLFVGATDGDFPVLFRNRGDGTFVDVTAELGLLDLADSVSATAGDFDGDGFLDLFLSHWGAPGRACHLWKNHGGKRFVCADEEGGIDPIVVDGIDTSFTAIFSDLDGDRDPDLLVTADFGTSRVLLNQGGRFERADVPAISDENGMGAAVGDYDGDGVFDWFVSSVWDADGVTEGDWGTTGNRLYRGLGGGAFEDRTDDAGVRAGDWGWAACFADLDRDAVLDLVHVNGWPQGSSQFRDTPARLFVGGPSGRFAERAEELGFVERTGGRGVVCFDHDDDGDIDLFVTNHRGPAHLFRNEGPTGTRYLKVRLEGAYPNREGIGAIVRIRAGGREQLREIRAGSNYVSQDPAIAHFGLDIAARVDAVDVLWPSQAETHLEDVPADRTVVVKEPDRTRHVAPRNAGCGGPFG
jgi:enediyne biosynthesis protein E4